MGEAKRRKQLDPNYGKPLPEVLKYVVDYIQKSLKSQRQKGEYADAKDLFFTITNLDKGFTVEERQLITDNRHLFARYHVAITHAENLDAHDIYIPDSEPIFNANPETIAKIILKMSDPETVITTQLMY